MDANEAERCERTDALGSMWQGGGFGLEGAIKGAVQAEALNLAGAAVSGIFNAAGRKAEAARMLEEQKVFFENPETPASVAQGVYDALAEMYIDLFRYVDKNCPEIQIKQLTADDISKSKSLLSNMQKGVIPDDKIFDHCLKVLMLNPLYTEAYEFILLKYPDCKHTILEMDEFFYIGVIRDMMYNQLDSFFATLDVSDEEKAWAARKTMADKATELGINNFQSYPELEKIVKNFDKEYRTVEGMVYETREEADKYKELWQFFNSQDFSGIHSEVAAKVDSVHQKAAELNISDDCLASLIEKKFADCQLNAQKALDSYYASLDLETEEKALEAVALMNKKAAELELQGFESYQPLTELLAEFDRKARTVAGKLFDTREETALQQQAYTIYKDSSFCQSLEQALKTKDELIAFQEQNNINASWLITDVDQAITHHDELMKTKFGYRYNSYDECNNASSDAKLFSQAVWSAIYRYSVKNNIKQWSELTEKVQETVRTTLNLSADEEVFLYISTEMLAGGNSGLAFTTAGLAWSNGSALVSKALDNKLVKSLFSKVKAASDLQEKFKVNANRASWKEFFDAKTSLSGARDKDIEITSGGNFEADFINAPALRSLLEQLRAFATESSIDFTDKKLVIERNTIQGEMQSTPLPDLK
ncbi:MAG: hypothetical protein IJC21_00030 [Lentisphaeria bacterium]|nr:hypothetical protein [Lentisphaeria bacterium]